MTNIDFDVLFNIEDTNLDIVLDIDGVDMDILFDNAVVVEKQEYPDYQGETQILPRKSQTDLQTQNTVVKDTISVLPITYLEVPNSSGGCTITIGLE